MNSPQNGSPAYLILGAAGGIGSALSRSLAAKGARLMLAGRSQEKLEGLAAELGSEHIEVDATQTDQVSRCVEETAKVFGSIQGAVNCVGSLLLKPAHLTSDEDWNSTLTTNLTSAFALVRAAVPAMRREGGSIVLISSAAARLGIANHEAIAAAKAGIIGLTLSAAATYAKTGIRVNCVAPGLVQTPMTQSIVSSEAGRKMSTAMHPLGRLGEPSDVASLIDWLLDPKQVWITGQVFGADGGLATLQSRNS